MLGTLVFKETIVRKTSKVTIHRALSSPAFLFWSAGGQSVWCPVPVFSSCGLTYWTPMSSCVKSPTLEPQSFDIEHSRYLFLISGGNWRFSNTYCSSWSSRLASLRILSPFPATYNLSSYLSGFPPKLLPIGSPCLLWFHWVPTGWIHHSRRGRFLGELSPVSLTSFTKLVNATLGLAWTVSWPAASQMRQFASL